MTPAGVALIVLVGTVFGGFILFGIIRAAVKAALRDHDRDLQKQALADPSRAHQDGEPSS